MQGTGQTIHVCPALPPTALPNLITHPVKHDRQTQASRVTKLLFHPRSAGQAWPLASTCNSSRCSQTGRSRTGCTNWSTTMLFAHTIHLCFRVCTHAHVSPARAGMWGLPSLMAYIKERTPWPCKDSLAPADIPQGGGHYQRIASKYQDSHTWTHTLHLTSDP